MEIISRTLRNIKWQLCKFLLPKEKGLRQRGVEAKIGKGNWSLKAKLKQGCCLYLLKQISQTPFEKYSAIPHHWNSILKMIRWWLDVNQETTGASLSPPFRSKDSSPKTGPTLALTSPSGGICQMFQRSKNLICTSRPRIRLWEKGSMDRMDGQAPFNLKPLLDV